MSIKMHIATNIFVLCYLVVMKDLYEHVNPRNRKHSPLISKQTYDIIKKHEDVSEYCI